MADDNARPPVDSVVQTITDYVFDYQIVSTNAWTRARLALLDSLACAFESLPVCSSFVGPTVKDTVVPNGFPLPGTLHVLEPLKAAFDLGSLIRYRDHNDGNPGAEWGHPSDNIGAILPIADWVSRQGDDTITIRDVLEAIVKAYEIQGCFQIRNSFNKIGLDHVILVKVAATAVISKLLGLSRAQTNDAVSQAFADGHPMRIYRQAPNTSPRKGWAAGDACMRAVHLTLMTKSGQSGFPTVLTAPRWGFYDTVFQGKHFDLPSPFEAAVIQRTVFKIPTAEGHAISAVEAARDLSRDLGSRADSILSVHIRTHKAAMTIINKTGPLYNPADRDHCMQYMVALTLLKGDWPSVNDYEDDSPWANDPRIDMLRERIIMEEDHQMTYDYHHNDKYSNGLTVTLEDGSILPEVVVDRPVGHWTRAETIDEVQKKFLGLTDGILRSPQALWDFTMNEESTQAKVRDWVDMVNEGCRVIA